MAHILLLGAVTHTTVNGISHGKFFRGTSPARVLEYRQRVHASRFQGKIQTNKQTNKQKCHTFSPGKLNQNLSLIYNSYCFQGQLFCNVQSLFKSLPKLSKLSFYPDNSWRHFDVCGVLCQSWITRFIFVYKSYRLVLVNSKCLNFGEEQNYLNFMVLVFDKIDKHSSKLVERTPKI